METEECGASPQRGLQSELAFITAIAFGEFLRRAPRQLPQRQVGAPVLAPRWRLAMFAPEALRIARAQSEARGPGSGPRAEVPGLCGEVTGREPGAPPPPNTVLRASVTSAPALGPVQVGEVALAAVRGLPCSVADSPPATRCSGPGLWFHVLVTCSVSACPSCPSSTAGAGP